MILINLLPRELRHQEARKINIPYRLIAFGVFLVFLGLALYSLFLYVRIREEYRAYDQRWKALAQKSGEADNLERELGAFLVAEIDFYDAFIDPPLETARVLNSVSDLIPKSAWLNQFKFERNQKEIQLVLNGLTESTGKGGLRLIEIQNFANGLKNEMEQHVGPGSQANPNVKRPVRVTVTTSSQKSDAEKREITQFLATFYTEGFTQK